MTPHGFAPGGRPGPPRVHSSARPRHGCAVKQHRGTEIGRSRPDIPVILFSLHLSEDLISHFESGGIRGAVSKGEAARDLVEAVKKVLAGGTFFPSKSASRAQPAIKNLF